MPLPPGLDISLKMTQKSSPIALVESKDTRLYLYLLLFVDLFSVGSHDTMLASLHSPKIWFWLVKNTIWL
jgi:hypothetical protein